MTNPTILLLIYDAFTICYAANKGFYTITSVLAVIVIFAAALFFSTSKTKEFYQNLPSFEQTLRASLLLMAFLALINYGGWDVTRRQYLIVGMISHIFLVIIAGLYFLKPRISGKLAGLMRHKTLIYLGLIILVKIMVIMAAPSPKIDVYHLVTQAGQNVAHGINPYDYTYDLRTQAGYLFSYFNYLPLSFLVPLPFKIIFGDIRYAYIALDLATAVCLYILAARSFSGTHNEPVSILLPLLFLTNPIHAFILESAWVEPIMVFWLALFTILFSKRQSLKYSPLAIGFLLATKQYALLGTPLLLKLKGWRLRHWISATLAASLVTLPFYFWSPKDFMDDLFGYYVKYEPRFDAMTIPSLLHNDFVSIENWLRAAVDNPYLAYSIVALPAAVVLGFIFINQTRSLTGFLSSFAVLLMGFFLFSKMSFANYDYLIGSILLISISCTGLALPENTGENHTSL